MGVYAPPGRVGWVNSITPLGVHPLPHLTNVFTSWQNPVHATTHKRICSSLLLNLNSFNCMTYPNSSYFSEKLCISTEKVLFLSYYPQGWEDHRVKCFPLYISNANEMLKKIGIKLLFESYYLCIFPPQMYVFKPQQILLSNILGYLN